MYAFVPTLLLLIAVLCTQSLCYVRRGLSTTPPLSPPWLAQSRAIESKRCNVQHGHHHHRCHHDRHSSTRAHHQPKIKIITNPLHRLLTYPSRKVGEVRSFFRTELPMLQYLWPADNLRLRCYLVLSMAFMFAGKWFNLRVPFLLQNAIDNISSAPAAPIRGMLSSIATPIGSAIGWYGLSRALSVVCSEAKTCLFMQVSQDVLRKFANQIFGHLHALDSDFHLQTPSGVVSVAYVRAVRGFQTMLFQLVFSVAPTLLELMLVANVLYRKFAPVFALVTLATFTLYLVFTVLVTQWRITLRQELVDVDNARNGFFIDSILNHEVVKLFSSERREALRFDSYLARIERLSIDSTYAVAVLNLGQAALFCAGLTSSLLIALLRVQAGVMSVGDLVAVNSMLLQLSIPFNFMGYTYQELRQSFVDMGYMRGVLTVSEGPQATSYAAALSPTTAGVDSATQQRVGTSALSVDPMQSTSPSSIEFRNVTFHYRPRIYHNGGKVDIEASQGINGEVDSEEASNSTSTISLLKNVSFSIQPGQNVAIVGPSGSGKSTILKLITRMLHPESGDILLDRTSIVELGVEEVRRRVAVVPQDTSLFDETMLYNIRYGNQFASAEEVQAVVRQSNLQTTVDKLPQGLHTLVGERGARLSGGERQKVSIARALLRNPSLILCDEITSSVDAFAERDIIETLRRASSERTTITVAHRLSSVVHCDKILVLQDGVLLEQGRHADLLKIPGGVYRSMWSAQNSVSAVEG